MTERYFQAVHLIKISLRWISFLRSHADVAPLHSRRCNCRRPVGSGGPHRLLGADHRSPSAHRCPEAGVLDGENRLGPLAFRTDRDRQAGHRGHHSGPTGRLGAGVRPLDSPHLWLRQVLRSGAPTEQPGGPAEGGGEEERRIGMRENGKELRWTNVMIM